MKSIIIRLIQYSFSLTPVLPWLVVPELCIKNDEFCIKHDEFCMQGGLLSNLQLEGALYACQRHSRFLPGASTPTRYAFFLGDGAGVGKGRQVRSLCR